MDRRLFLAGGLSALGLAACSRDRDAVADQPASRPPDGQPRSTASVAGEAALLDRPLTSADFAGLGTCALIPEMAAGPFPNLQRLVRRDLTEGVPGRPVRLGLRVVDGDCAPVDGAEVEVWHTDATGDYSSYDDGGTGKDEGAGSTFLRGSQAVDDDGIVDFVTIYPGWYPGRAVHIHVRVRRGDELLRTTQLFLPDEVTRAVLATGAYASFGPPDTTNATDGLGGDITTNGSLLHVTPVGTAADAPLVALLNLGMADQP